MSKSEYDATIEMAIDLRNKIGDLLSKHGDLDDRVMAIALVECLAGLVMTIDCPGCRRMIAEQIESQIPRVMRTALERANQQGMISTCHH